MVDWNDPLTWRFGLRRLLAAITVNAVACGAMVADVPGEIHALGLCVLLFSFGFAVLIVGAGLTQQTMTGARFAGQIVMSLGFVLTASSVVVAFIIVLGLIAYYALRLAA